MRAYAQEQKGAALTIVAFGDSLTAGYGLLPGKSYPSLLEARLRAAGYIVRVVNAGVSGDTTGNGLSRLAWVLEEKPALAIVALGANDSLRGQDPKRSEAHLDAILERLSASGATLLLAGMYAPRNMGAAYVKEFDGMYPRLASKHGATLYPFLLEGVAGDPKLNQDDGLHPNEAGAAVIAERLYPVVEQLVGRLGGKGGR